MANTWVIGNAENSIGEAVQTLLHKEGFGPVTGTGTEVDVTSPKTLENFLIQNGPFDDVVYCAGIASLQWIKDLDPIDIMQVFDVNVFGFMNVIKALVTTQTVGNVVVVVSDASHQPMRGSMAYCTSKAALHQAVRVAARELAPKWRINGVSPAAVEGTRMTAWIDENVPKFRGWKPDQAKEYELASLPMKRRITREETAQGIVDVLFGVKYMNGAIVPLTGGK